VAHSNKYGKQLESLATKQLYQQYEFDCFEDQLSFLNRCRLQSGSVCGDIVDSKILLVICLDLGAKIRSQRGVGAPDSTSFSFFHKVIV